MSEDSAREKCTLHIAAEYYYWKLAMAYWAVYELEVYRRFVSLPSECRILDVGCGDGTFGEMMSEVLGLDNNLVGIDVDRKSIQVANNRRIYETAYCCDSSSMPFREDEFSAAFSNQVLHCIHEGPDSTLDEIGRVLEKGGLFACTVLTDVAMDNLYIVRVLKNAGLYKLSNLYKRNMIERLPAMTLPEIDEWCEKIESSGMNVLEVVPFMYGERYKVWSIFMMLPFRVMGLLKLISSNVINNYSSRITESFLSKTTEENICFDNDEYGDSVLIVAKKR